MYQVLLYYKFVTIDNPEQFAKEHLAMCKELGLLGRILVATEGLNGTVSGTVEQCKAYMDAVHADPRFADLWFKIDDVDELAFKKMFVRVKKELVTFNADHPTDPSKKSGKRLSPVEFHEMLQRDDVIVLDGRTDYEFDAGHFRGAIRPPIDSFRLFPEWIKENMAHLKDKHIITYCTGGIRCEKLTAYMLEENFTNVYQLEGGIVTYGKDPVVKGSLWDGKCYVFDERILVDINHTDDKQVVSFCFHCGKPAERLVNCANMLCHRQHAVCEDCEAQTKRSCSIECMNAAKREHIA
ncbi:MAG: rhodanese-related sulfurtransferase [Bradyrhizobiaceae bacterium]|nr:rhodanese-related sulfurtransferase [Bradyrhizobiaceae bacterium]